MTTTAPGPNPFPDAPASAAALVPGAVASTPPAGGAPTVGSNDTPPPPKQRPDGGRNTSWLLGLVVPALLLVLWTTASAQGWISPRTLPSPEAVLDAGTRFFTGDRGRTLPGVVPFEGAGALHIAASVQRWLVAYLLAVAIGVPLGLGLGLSRIFRRLFDPLVQALRSIPVTAWLPIALAWFGLGEGSARYLVFIGAVFPIVIATGDASLRVPHTLVDTAQMLGTNRRDLARRVYLPAAFPGIVTGLRLGLTLGWMSVIVGELSGQSEGIGAMMFAARASVQTDQIIVGMAAFAIIGLAGDLLLRGLTRPVTRWSDG